jgi:large subunit ribosomal protein L6
MSRVGKMPVAIPAGVDVSIKDDQISVKGFWWSVAAQAKCFGEVLLTTLAS